MRAWRDSSQENRSPDFSLENPEVHYGGVKTRCTSEETAFWIRPSPHFCHRNVSRDFIFAASLLKTMELSSAELTNWQTKQTKPLFFRSHTWQQNQSNLGIDNRKVKYGITYLPSNIHRCNMIARQDCSAMTPSDRCYIIVMTLSERPRWRRQNRARVCDTAASAVRSSGHSAVDYSSCFHSLHPQSLGSRISKRCSTGDVIIGVLHVVITFPCDLHVEEAVLPFFTGTPQQTEQVVVKLSEHCFFFSIPHFMS